VRVVISGSRTINDKDLVWKALDKSKFNITELVSGGAQGVDTLGERWARSKNIPIKVYRPDYSIPNPKYAPLLRNQKMAEYGDALVAIWADGSRGTAHMIGCMEKLHKPMEVTKV
jgi:hypothetical protein